VQFEQFGQMNGESPRLLDEREPICMPSSPTSRASRVEGDPRERATKILLPIECRTHFRCRTIRDVEVHPLVVTRRAITMEHLHTGEGESRAADSDNTGGGGCRCTRCTCANVRADISAVVATRARRKRTAAVNHSSLGRTTSRIRSHVRTRNCSPCRGRRRAGRGGKEESAQEERTSAARISAREDTRGANSPAIRIARAYARSK